MEHILLQKTIEEQYFYPDLAKVKCVLYFYYPNATSIIFKTKIIDGRKQVSEIIAYGDNTEKLEPIFNEVYSQSDYNNYFNDMICNDRLLDKLIISKQVYNNKHIKNCLKFNGMTK